MNQKYDDEIIKTAQRFAELDKFSEIVAALCHEQWSGWMLYLFSKSQRKNDGSVVIPPELAARWNRQMTTSYENLPEKEKDSDRIEADKFVKLFGDNSAITERKD